MTSNPDQCVQTRLDVSPVGEREEQHLLRLVEEQAEPAGHYFPSINTWESAICRTRTSRSASRTTSNTTHSRGQARRGSIRPAELRLLRGSARAASSRRAASSCSRRRTADNAPLRTRPAPSTSSAAEFLNSRKPPALPPVAESAERPQRASGVVGEYLEDGSGRERENARRLANGEEIDAVDPDIALQLEQERVLLAQDLHDLLVAEDLVQSPHRIVQSHRVDHEIARSCRDLPRISPRGVPK